MKPAIAVLIALFLLGSACTPQSAPAPITEAAPETSTSLPTLTPTSIPTFTPTPANTPTIAPTPDPIRSTPPTLMLHRPNSQFDSLAFLKEFVKLLKQNNMKVVTYRDIDQHPGITAAEKGKLFIITIDDISLAYPITQDVIEMIVVLQEAKYPAVLGVVTETDYPDPGNLARLKELADAGWEIASHTDTHANLEKLERASSKLVYNEVIISLDKLEKATGVRPITLVLPDGQMVNYIGTLDNLGLRWVVGINGGVTYDSRKKIIYLGREGPAKDAEYTYKIMKMRFGF